MSTPIKCPRCGHLNTFMKGFLSDTCVCRVCQSQLDWREVPGLGPDCRPLDDAEAAPDVPDAAAPNAAAAPGASSGRPRREP